MNIHARIIKTSSQKISINKAMKFVCSDNSGAEAIFIGRVRNINNGKKVTAVTYDAHDELVSTSFEAICKMAKKKFDKNAKIFIEHSKGYVAVGEISILIAVGSNHRDESFKICRYILEEVKHRAPIWKKEHYVKGREEWLPGYSLRPKEEIKSKRKF